MSPRKNIIQIGDLLPTKEQPKRLPCDLDLQKFLTTRALVQAESGGGKSYLLRRLAEQSYNFLPPIIIDPEGEFASLREKDDYIICAPTGADAVATPATASLLALKILETGVAAVVDIFEMSPGDQRTFVQRFFDALTNAPKNLWTPRLVILDEMQMFAQEGDRGAVCLAVQNASKRWRKRGFVLVGATPRISAVSKDVTAGLRNKFIGGTSQDIDVARAARELGMRDIHAATDALRRLEPGEFYCYGPALSHDVRKIMVGSVQTSHPESGSKRMKAPPPPSKKIRELLASLADLPKEAEIEATTAAELRTVLKQKEARIRELEKGAPAAASKIETKIEVKIVEKPVITAAQLKRLETVAKALTGLVDRLDGAKTSVLEAAKSINETFAAAVKAAQPAPTAPAKAAKPASAAAPERRAAAAPSPPAPAQEFDGQPITGPEQRLLDAIAWWNKAGTEAPSNEAVAVMAMYSVSSSSFGVPRAKLTARGLIEYSAGTLRLTAVGSGFARVDIELSNAAIQERALSNIDGPEKRLLEPLLKAYPDGMSNDELAAASRYAATSSSYGVPRAKLKSLGLIKYEGGTVTASDILFPYR